MSLQKMGLDWAERGILPDSVIRYGIRRLCRDRLRQEHDGGCEREQQSFREHLEAARRGPIAPVPELANEQHYEVPSAFYDRSLGARKKYSCCHWDDSTPNLDAAEERALAITCERAQLEDGDRILELGCGWGSLTLWMAEHYPASQITAVSNSASQREFIESELARRGFDHVTIITRDVNELELEEEFDRVVSVEMFEHMRNYERLLDAIAAGLEPDGRVLVHIFCHRHVPYDFATE
ncbi:MAG: class I SAM-dependent methyltransferase, partial [Planctomycetota bacterium]